MSHDHDPNTPHDIGCLEAIEGLYAWLDGELDDAGAIEHIEQHISHCQSCYSRAEMEKLLTHRMRESGKSEPEAGPSGELQDRLRNLMDRF